MLSAIKICDTLTEKKKALIKKYSNWFKLIYDFNWGFWFYYNLVVLKIPIPS